MGHECPGCGAPGVADHLLGCKPCWQRLPSSLRGWVSSAYRLRNQPGATAAQRAQRTQAHLRAVRAALRWYRDNQEVAR